jgi:hypothetical protein
MRGTWQSGAWRAEPGTATPGVPALRFSTTAQHALPPPPPPSSPSLVRGLRLVAVASLAGAAAVVLPNLSAQGAPHAVALMATDSPTYRAAGAARAARLARAVPGGPASLAAAGAPAVLASVIGSGDPDAAADACSVASALVGVSEDLGALEGAAAVAEGLVAGGGPAGDAARDFLWALRKKKEQTV